MTSSDPRQPTDAAGAAPPRQFGPFELRALVAKSRRSMVWRVADHRTPGSGHARFLLLPRTQPVDAEAAQQWEQAVRRASRLKHPALADPLQIGSWQRWPFVLYDAAGWQTLPERCQGRAVAAMDAAALLAQALQGLAFAHEGGVAHRDLQPCMLLVDEHDRVRVMGLELSLPDAPAAEATHHAVDALHLHEQRAAARVDVLCAGLLLHLLLSGQPPMGEADLVAAAERLPPSGRDLVRLPWNTPLPVPEALRAIANRAADRQPRQRYGSARGLARALEGWLQAEGSAGGGPLALLLDRLHSVGSLPASPGGEARAARLASMDRERTNELAQVVLQDLGLAFELLRWANSAQLRAAHGGGHGAVLTVRRAISILGVEGVRRAATGLRPWPGALSDVAAQALHGQCLAAQRAGRVAQALRPAGYDAEVVHLVTLLQNLGRLIAAYHFPDELQQIRRLVQPAAPEHPGEPSEAGMSEQAASHAVLGVDIEAIGATVARQWGLDEAVLHLIRRMPLATQPRAIDNDEDMLRAVASCANEAADALWLPSPDRPAALRRIAQRYGRALGIGLRDLQVALAASGSTRKPQAATSESLG